MRESEGDLALSLGQSGLGANLSTAASACLDSLSHTSCRSHFSWSVHQDMPSLEITGNSCPVGNDWKRLELRLTWSSGVLKESKIHNMSYRSFSTIVACSPACFLLQRNRVPSLLCPFLSIFFHGALPLAAIDQQWATICFTHSKSQGVFVWKQAISQEFQTYKTIFLFPWSNGQDQQWFF